MEFVEIAENWREYRYKDGSSYKIYEPCRLYRKDTSHRVVDLQGVVHWVSLEGLLSIKWYPSPDCPEVQY